MIFNEDFTEEEMKKIVMEEKIREECNDYEGYIEEGDEE